MKKTNLFISFHFLAIILFVITSCKGSGSINGSGKQISEIREVQTFSDIEIHGAMKVVLKQDFNQQVSVSADDNVQQYIEVKVNNETLKIEMDDKVGDSGPITVYLNAKDFKGIKASGAVDITSDGNLKVQDFLLDLSGSSKVNLNLNAANLITKSSGSSDIKLAGQASSHDVDMSGSGSIEALDFIAGKYHIESSGSNKLRINVLNELSVNSSGSSDVEYRGNPATVKNDNSGSSRVQKIN